MPDAIPRLSPEAWERACRSGENAVRKALGPATMRQIKSGAGTEAHLAPAIGALVAIGDLLFHLSTHGDRWVMETLAVAYLRGAVRGEDAPVNEDGSAYTGARADA